MTVFEYTCLTAFCVFMVGTVFMSFGVPFLCRESAVENLTLELSPLEATIRREVIRMENKIESKRIIVFNDGPNECATLSSDNDERWYRTDFESVPVLGAEKLTKANGSLESVPCKSFGDVPVNVLSSLCEHGARLEDAGTDKCRSDDAA